MSLPPRALGEGWSDEANQWVDEHGPPRPRTPTRLPPPVNARPRPKPAPSDDPRDDLIEEP